MAERIKKTPLKEAVSRIRLQRDSDRSLAEYDAEVGGMKLKEALEDAALTAVVEFGEALLRGDSTDVSLLVAGAVNRAREYAKGRELERTMDRIFIEHGPGLREALRYPDPIGGNQNE